MAKIDFKMRVPVRYEPREGGVVAFCDLLDVVAEGRDRGEAESRLREAIHLFIETCFVAGTLDEVLRAAGFTSEADEQVDDVDEGEEILVPMSLIASARGRETRPR